MRDGAALTIRRADQLEPRRDHGGFRAGDALLFHAAW
jgi:hypothetical protein